MGDIKLWDHHNTLLTMLVELLIMAVVILVAIFCAVKIYPGTMEVLNRLQMRLSFGGLNPDVLQRILGPLHQ